uniref:Rhodanese domain-containing protein n=1 Tax=Mola mola TaxID=94237 RepID=A0A3Q3WY02_MOLML
MSLGSCRRFAAVVPRLVPRLLWNSRASVPGGRSFVSSLHSTHPRCKTSVLLLRGLSSGVPSTDVTYEQLKQLLAGRKSLVIDVREPWELREYGSIPGSINVPLGQVNTALQLGREEFREKYGGELPQLADNIVFSCLSGVRSKAALDTAQLLNISSFFFSLYFSVQHFLGGWQEWMKKEQQN